MALVTEIQKRCPGQTLVVARFVLQQSGAATAVEVAPRGLALVRDAIDRGVPWPDGRPGNVTMADGLPFLHGLAEAYRRPSLRATAPFTLDDAAALRGRDLLAPPAMLRLTELTPRARELYRVSGRTLFQLGDGPDCELCLTPIRDHSGVYVRLRWQDGWYWIEPGESPAAGVLDGLTLKTMTPGNRAPLDPGARLIFGDRTFELDYPLPPGATAGASP